MLGRTETSHTHVSRSDTSHDEQNQRVLEQFDQQAARYAAMIAGSRDTTLPLILDAMRPQASDRVLDVGCGVGNFAVTMAPLVAHVVGVDLTPAMLEQARQLQAAAAVSNVEWREADVTALPFDDEAFDIVASRAMLHHVHEPTRVIAEMQRVCRRGGYLMVQDLTPVVEKAAAFNAIEILRDPSHTRALTTEEFRAIGVELGLEEVLLHQYGPRLPVESTLQASSPPGVGMLERIRALYRFDAESGGDALGFEACVDEGVVMVRYPMTLLIWRRS